MPRGRIGPVVNSPDKIQLNRLSHVYFSHCKIEKFDQFASDFGFEEAGRDSKAIYYRGWGQDSCAYVALRSENEANQFHGAAFVAETERDFIKSTQLEGASTVRNNSAPGGGKIVTIASPSGSKIHVLWGQQDRPAPEKPVSNTEIHKGGYNTTLQKLRKGEFQRFKLGPAMVHKLGHYGFLTSMFDEDVEFYTGNFNFVPSDILYEEIQGEEIDTLTFMHLDHGGTYVDHHTLFLSRTASGREEVSHPPCLL